MKRNYKDTELQAAIDEAFAKGYKAKTHRFFLSPSSFYWDQEAPNRLDLIKSALAALPEPEPLVTKPISPPTWTPEIGDVVTLKSGGAKMTVVKLTDTEGGLLAFLCEWFSDSGEYDSGVIYLTSLQPA
jgi:uncharacterized protein YodC (DUF2158 family)